jgi:hypothetical protein
MRVEITKDTSGGKKMKAVFYEGTKRIKTVRFGAGRADDFTRGATDEQQKAYKARHAGDKLTDKFSAGALSMYVLVVIKKFSRWNCKLQKKI